MLLSIIMFVIIIGLGSTALIMASNYVDSVANIIDTVYNFITGNLFGFLVLIAVIFLFVALIRKYTSPKGSSLTELGYKAQREKYIAKQEKYSAYPSKVSYKIERQNYKKLKKTSKKGGFDQ